MLFTGKSNDGLIYMLYHRLGRKSSVKVLNTLQYDISVTPNYAQQGLWVNL